MRSGVDFRLRMLTHNSRNPSDCMRQYQDRHNLCGMLSMHTEKAL